METPTRRKDRRPTITYKGEEFGPEFRALINKAAERSGMSQAAFVAETLRREAQRIIKATPADNPSEAPLPVVVHDPRLDAHERVLHQLAEQVGKLIELQAAAHSATLWGKLRGALWGASRGDAAAA